LTGKYKPMGLLVSMLGETTTALTENNAYVTNQLKLLYCRSHFKFS